MDDVDFADFDWVGPAIGLELDCCLERAQRNVASSSPGLWPLQQVAVPDLRILLRRTPTPKPGRDERDQPGM